MVFSAWLVRFNDSQRNLCFGLKLTDSFVDFQKKAGLFAPICGKYLVALTGWLSVVGSVSDFQRNLCFGLKLADRVVDFLKKADSWMFFLLCFADLKSPTHDYPSRLFYTLKTILLSRMNEYSKNPRIRT